MFAHLHTHSEYSLLDGLSKIPDLVTRASELGQQALAVTDHGALYGAIELYETANAHGIKPIIGLEAYVATGSRHQRTQDAKSPHHLTLLAKDETGYQNLLKLSTLSHLEGFYYRPRIDRELLELHKDGLIVLSGCPSGELMGALADGRDADAEETIGWYRDVFPGKYYIELQEHEQAQFSRLTPELVRLARRMDLPLVLTNDSHYTYDTQHQVHDVLLCIGTNATVQDTNRMRLEGNSFYLKSEQEMRTLFPELPEAADNTVLIAEQVDIRLQFGRSRLPDAGVPAGVSAQAHLRQLSEEGVRSRYGKLSSEQTERLEYELRIIEETGFVEYILIVRDIAHFARERSIPMGVRGSAAASMVLYCLNVTDIEPTQYRLVFERFLNPERISMPDVDFDFADDRRDEVMRYAAQRFGHDRVAQIITFGTLGAKAAIRDTGRALGMTYGETDVIAQLIPDTLHVTIDHALDEVAELSASYQADESVRRLVDTARGLEGVARHASTHAAGIVITHEPLTEVVPLQRPITSRGGNTDVEELLPTTQYAMSEVEKIGLLKLDLLGLTNLTILGRAVDLIREHQNEEIDLTTLPDGDESTAALLATGDTFGVFQMESAGMRRYVAELQPRNISEAAAMVALYRPGPMEHIPRFIDAKHGRMAPHYLHPDLAEILDETYGVITYQDQVLEIAQKFAGFSLGQADVMRKAMGKKTPEVMLAERQRFIEGAIERGYEQRLAEQLFDVIEPFAGYAFNKAHAFSYGMIAYQTAYLKAHYPAEFMTAVLFAAGGALERISTAIAECTRLSLRVEPPDVGRSLAHFSLEREDDGSPTIRYGLTQIKNVGANAIDHLIGEREQNGPFTSLEDFARRIDPRELNRRALESLAMAGALDTLAPDVGNDGRGAVVSGVDRILSLAQQEQRLRETGQTSMFDMFGSEVDTPLPALELDPVPTTSQQLLAWEKELLGTYISSHPFKDASEELKELTTHQASEISAELDGQEAVVAGTVTRVRRITTRQGKPFAAVTIEDLGGNVELTAWPEAYEEHRELLVEGNVILARILISRRGERLTAAVQDLVAYDLDSQTLIDFEPTRFKPRPPRNSGKPSHHRRSNQSNGASAHSRVNHSLLHDQSTQAGSMNNNNLRAIHTPTPTPIPEPASLLETDARVGPRRLRIAMEETTDEPADIRRLTKVLSRLNAHPGELPVELIVQTRSGAIERLELPDRVSISDNLIPQVRGLLGVLGDAGEVGHITSSEPSVTATADAV